MSVKPMPFELLIVQCLILAISVPIVFSRPAQESNNLTRQQARTEPTYVNETKKPIKQQLIMDPNYDVSDIKQPVDQQRTKLQIEKWDHLDLTWSLRNTLENVSIDLVKSDIKRAFKMWSKYSPLTFREVDSEFANIELSFEKGLHGDQYPFRNDNPPEIRDHLNYIYHVTCPMGGKRCYIHLNGERNWLVGNQTNNDSGGYSLFSDAVTSIGISLGLERVYNDFSIMNERDINFGSDFELPEIDQTSIQHLYGKKTTTVTTEDTTTDTESSTTITETTEDTTMDTESSTTITETIEDTTTNTESSTIVCAVCEKLLLLLLLLSLYLA